MRWQQIKQSLQIGLARFFYGRNGPDQLSAALLILSVLVSLLSSLLGLPWLYFLYYPVLVVCIYRMLSRNLVRRRAENAWFTAKTGAVAAWLRLRRRMLRERGEYRYLKCPHCGQRLRVPKGRGRIQITCSRCTERMIKTV